MKIVIDIPNEDYEFIKNLRSVIISSRGDGKIVQLINAIKNGTPLPKGHGRLIDAEKLANDVNALKDNWYKDFNMNEYESGRYESYDYVETITIEEAPTIIEADEEGDENE